MVKHVGENEFSSVTNGGVVLVDFYATWCPPCKMLAPILEELGSSRKYNIVKVDIDQSPNLSRQFGVDSVPTLVVLKEGKQVEKTVGYIGKEQVMDLMDKHIES